MISDTNKSSLDGRKMLILGGTGGIGLALAEAMSSLPVELHILGRSQARLAAAARKIEAAGQPALPPVLYCTDLDDQAQLARLLELVRTVDILVISRGSFIEKSLRDTSAEEWSATTYSNLTLPGLLASAAASAMAERGFGRILLFGGTRTETIRGYRHNAAYAAAKTGLAVIVKSIAAEFSRQGVACTMICPGFVDTEYLSEETRDRLRNLSARKRLMPSSSIAALCRFLLEGAIETVNGTIINADDGLYSL
ncbi:MAG: SDR family NAD(P)-dependent oxidoreductase [Spirochaetes bacterium]|nr:SDR family NAD(P)-dependent oxidoreductase [Spirochaetota bacterium]MBU0955384.1 SDR family NAD(P)-dependent oxidoreductase [Spirochaetota bacterium]